MVTLRYGAASKCQDDTAIDFLYMILGFGTLGYHIRFKCR